MGRPKAKGSAAKAKTARGSYEETSDDSIFASSEEEGPVVRTSTTTRSGPMPPTALSEGAGLLPTPAGPPPPTPAIDTMETGQRQPQRRLQHSWPPMPQQRIHPQVLVCRFLCRIPSSSTLTSSSGRIRKLVWSRQALQTDVLHNNMTTESLVLRIAVLRCSLAIDPLYKQLRQQPMQNAPATLCVDMAVPTAPLDVCSALICPQSGLLLHMDTDAASNLQTAGCQVCWPVRGCSPAMQGLDVAKCSPPYASTGRPGRGPSLTPVSLCLPDSTGRWETRGGFCAIWPTQTPLMNSVCCCTGSCCNLRGSCAQPCSTTVGNYCARVARGLTRESHTMTDTPRPDNCCALAFCLPPCLLVSVTDKKSFHIARAKISLLSFPLKAHCSYHYISEVSYGTLTPINGNLTPFGRLQPSLPREAIMPPPVPPVKRFRYKPGKRERQERREQRAAAEAEWRARRPGQPRPQTVFGGHRGSSSFSHGPGEDHQEEDDSLETVLLEDEEHDDADNAAVTEEVAGTNPAPVESQGHTDAGEAVPRHRSTSMAEERLLAATATDREIAEVPDIPQPMTPPCHVLDDQCSQQVAEPAQAHDLTDVSTTQIAGNPGWLFNADVMAFAKAYDIRSAFVGDTEILIPRPKQASAQAHASMTATSEDNIRTVATPTSLHGNTAKRRSRWPGWKYARLATNPNGTERRWRTSLFAISLKRPWSCNWRQLYREMNCSWQLLSTRTVQDAWRLACGYRLAFRRRQWPQIQARLANISGHPKCEAIRRLVRAHQRLDERHRPEQHADVRAYMLGSACFSPVLVAQYLQLCPTLVLVTGRRLQPLIISGISLDCALHSKSQTSLSALPLAGRPMPRPLPGTTPLKAKLHYLGIPGQSCPYRSLIFSLSLGMCKALGPALRTHVRLEMDRLCCPKDQGICVVFLPSPRCQVCYRRHLVAAISYSSDHWTIGSSSTKSSCHDSLREPSWLDAQFDCRSPPHVTSLATQVHELSTSPSNKIGPWRVPWPATINCTGRAANVCYALFDSRTSVPTVKTLSKIPGRTGFMAPWKSWIDYASQILVHRPSCWGLRTRSRAYATKLPVRLSRHAVVRRHATRCHKPPMACTTSHTTSHLGPKSQGLAIHLTLQLLRHLYQQSAILNCEVEPRVGGMCQVPLRLSLTSLFVMLGKPRPERIKLSFFYRFMSSAYICMDQADTRVPDPLTHPRPMSTYLIHESTPATTCSAPSSLCTRLPPVPQHSCSVRPGPAPPYPTTCTRWLPERPRLILFTTLLLRAISPALTHPVYPAPLDGSSLTPQVPSRISKRSYKRAIARAAQSQQGGTMYKGRWCTLSSLSKQYLPQVPTASTKQARVRGPQPNGPHVRFLSFNCGGLSQDLYMELLKALEAMPAQTQPQIIALQETHWSSESAQQYTTGAWQVIQSHRHANRSAGVMLLIHRSLTRDAVISFGEPFPGRLLHVRITTKSWALDCVNVYQQTMQWQRHLDATQKTGDTTQPAAREIRQQVWTALESTLAKLPVRHTLLLLGDFNTPMQQHERAGPKVTHWNSRLPPDASRLTHLLEDYDLIHLNSWTKRMGPTFIWGDTRTLIDHAFIRSDSADSLARHTGRDKLRIGEWRKGGKHIPISGVMHLRRFAALNPVPTQSKVKWDKSTLLQLVKDPGDPRAQAILQQVGRNIEKCSSVQEINDCLVEASAAHAPAGARAQTNAPWQLATLDTSVKDMWSHYRQWKAAARGTTATIWKVWFHYARFRRAHRAFRSAGRLAKQSWYQGRLDELNKHARRHDVRALYQGVRALAPKTRKVHVQLRDVEGHVITPAEQAALLKRHYEAVYTGLQPQPDRTTKMPPLQVTEKQLERALSLMPTHKAVPLHLAPLAAWKICARVVVPRLTNIVNDLEITPDLWHKAWLALIPKLAKPTLPKHLRPIGLSEVSNRMVTKVLQDRLRPYVEKYLEDIPQWAYIPGRSTLDAAARVQAHCQHVIHLCSPDRWSVREARAGLPRPKQHAGGLQLSLDLSSAFDVLEWVYVAEALDDAGVPSELKDHLLEWYRNIHYDFTIQDHTESVAASRGLKQGCLVAPLIWSLATGRLLYRLALATDVRWVSQQVTAYADDFHAAATAHNHQDLQTAERFFSQFLDLLVQSGMIINASKSAILYRFIQVQRGLRQTMAPTTHRPGPGRTTLSHPYRFGATL